MAFIPLEGVFWCLIVVVLDCLIAVLTIMSVYRFTKTGTHFTCILDFFKRSSYRAICKQFYDIKHIIANDLATGCTQFELLFTRAASRIPRRSPSVKE